MIKDTSFYNKESAVYSDKRYPDKANTYVQSFFKTRLALVEKYLETYCESRKDLSVVEMGCADGIILRKLDEKIGSKVASYVGIDISPNMIEVARTLSTNSKMSYQLRDDNKTYECDIYIEIGVANYSDFKLDLMRAKESLRKDGLFVLSIAGKGSLNELFRGAKGYRNFLSYKEYEGIINQMYSIEGVIPVGLYIPFVWRIPIIARPLQGIMEKIMRPIVPNLFHEKIYFLKSRD